MGSSLRVFLVGGLISYRALFNWIRPYVYVPTMLGAPLFQIVFFTYLGRYSQAGRGDAFFVVGNAVQVCGMSCVYGMTMAVANERWFGTLGPLLATPASRVAVFLGRGLPVFANGLLVSAFGFGVGAALLDFRPPARTLPALLLTVCVTTVSCTAFGMVLGCVGLRSKDFFFAANLAYFLILLFCGVNVPLSALPGWMGAVGRCLPLTHGIDAARRIAAGAGLADVSGLLWTELAVGAAYAAAGYLAFRALEWASRRSAVLDAF
ncbi:MAG TPA: ABC transporter permease [Gaiellaceae bacterium]|nr:ABC transporter permease [Gaiellaceae bacterium]